MLVTENAEVWNFQKKITINATGKFWDETNQCMVCLHISARIFGILLTREKRLISKTLTLWSKRWGSLVDQVTWHLSLGEEWSKSMLLRKGTEKSMGGSFGPSQWYKISVRWIQLLTWRVARTAVAESFSRAGSDLKSGEAGTLTAYPHPKGWQHMLEAEENDIREQVLKVCF